MPHQAASSLLARLTRSATYTTRITVRSSTSMRLACPSVSRCCASSPSPTCTKTSQTSQTTRNEPMSTSAPAHVGVILMTYGSPASLEDVCDYMKNVRGGREPEPELVTEFKRRYQLIG